MLSTAPTLRVSKCNSGPPQDQRTDTKAKPGALDGALRWASDRWAGLDTQQRVYVVAAGAALVAASPTLLTVMLVPLERIFVGMLLAIEEVLAALLLGSARLVGMAGVLTFAAVGVYLFLLKKQPRA
ncbi:hypothetical protein GPECTOR_26g542 [Gonium pectorale]|uniref:Uncharacterized protein n=1 Tax=Gonium pectorale TaxID=33097 RepID=A0A150GFM7_GONPE|nr:hypothetical protein GPECTOR_26g542 [Gonium pectorale]|eukprot:KXZ48639.1 hypothetical protein GPECTOR_26g542 [Gonium pectorale]